MIVINQNIEKTIEVSDLDTSKLYSLELMYHANPSEKYTVNGFAVGNKVYFYFDSSVTDNMKVGNYAVNVYDSANAEMFYSDNGAVVRKTGL